MAKFAPMGDPHGDPQTSPQHADPRGFRVWFSFKKAPSPCGSPCCGLVCGTPWPVRKVTERSTKINILDRWVGGGGGLPRERVGVKKFAPSLESVFSLGFEGGNLGCPRNFGGMSRTFGGVQKVCAKKVRVHLSFPKSPPFLELRPFHPPRGVLGPFGPRVGNRSWKWVRGAFRFQGPKSLKKSRKRVKKVEKSWNFHFWLFFDSVFHFLDPRARRPLELIFNSVSNFGPEGPKNSSGGMEGSQS